MQNEEKIKEEIENAEPADEQTAIEVAKRILEKYRKAFEELAK